MASFNKEFVKNYEKLFGHALSKEEMEQFEKLQNDPEAQARCLNQVKLLSSPKPHNYWKLRKILLEAVKTGNQRAVSTAIKHGAEVKLNLLTPTLAKSYNLQPENDIACTFLGIAACHGHHNLIHCLLRAGIGIDDKGGSTRSPLQNAVENNHVKFATVLIKEGADIESRTDEVEAYTTLHCAVNRGSLESIELLIKEKANIEATDRYNYTPLHRAAMTNDLSAIEILLNAGCNRNARIHIGGTALHVAAIWNNREAAELLIKKGFDPQFKDYDGHTPMENAELRGHESLAHWLAKKIKGNCEDNDMEDLFSTGPLSSSEQSSKIEYSMSYYNADNSGSFNKVTNCTEDNLEYRQLKLNIPRINSGYYQDHKGHTVLHIASRNRHFRAVKLLVEELNIYPNLKAFNGDTPEYLARHAGHHQIANYLKKAVSIKPLPINIQIKLYDELLKVISTSDNVQDAQRLLKQGAPLESYGKTSPSALALAILWNRVMIIELLLAAGAPLTARHHGKTLLQVAWLSPDITMRVKTIISRAYYLNLMWEIEYVHGTELKYLDTSNDKEMFMESLNKLDSPGKLFINAGYKAVLEVLSEATPWKARWKIKRTSLEFLAFYLSTLGSVVPEFANLLPLIPLSNNPIGLSLQMGTATKNNCKLGVFFMNLAGGHPNHRTGCGLTPLHEALDANFLDLATVMVQHLGASLYIPDCNGRFPVDLMPAHMKNNLEKEKMVEEFNKLDTAIQGARSEAEKSETKEIALALVCLYAAYSKLWDSNMCAWQDLFYYLVSLVQDKPDLRKGGCKHEVRNNTQSAYTWVTIICQQLDQVNKKNPIQKEEVGVGALDLLVCIEELCKNIRINENISNIIQLKKKYRSSSGSISNVLMKSVKLSVENNFKIFLHLLLTIGKQSPHIPLNTMLQSLPIHHAAASGNFYAILYLTIACEASILVQDRNKNTAAHLAYMNGHIYIGDYLCRHSKDKEYIRGSIPVYSYSERVEHIINTAGQSPEILKGAFKEYEKLYDMLEDKDEKYESVILTEQINGMCLTTKLLEHWLSKTKKTSFRKIMKNSVVDYSYGEAKLLLSLVTDFARKIGNKIAEYNPLLKGTLTLVGSAGDNVRLNAPDECDCTIILEWENVKVHLEEMPKADQNIKNYKHIIKAESDDTEIQHLLEGTNLLEEFYFQCVKAVSELVSNLDPRISVILPGVKRIGCGVCITLAWAGITYPMLIVKMDLVPAFRATRPDNFPHPPLTKYTEDSRLDHIYVVQTHIQAGEKRCASTLTEQVVMQNLSSEQRLVFIMAKWLVSKLKTEDWASKHIKELFAFFSTKLFKLPAPTGFLLKSAFFRELENIPDPKDWKENCIVDRLKGIFYSMCKEREDSGVLVSGLVPSYFSSTLQPPAAGFMAPAIYRFLVNNEEKLRKMEDSTSDSIESEELDRLALMWDEALNKYYYIP